MSCDDVITLKQYGGTCWFNAILTAVLYSDESRKLLLEKSKTWDTSIGIFNTLSFILKNKYFRTNDKEDDYKYFERMKPENILVQLNEYNSETFKFNPNTISEGYFENLYIRKVYELLGVKVLYLDYYDEEKKYYYSLHNDINVVKKGRNLKHNDVRFVTKDVIDNLINNHDILIINVLDLIDKLNLLNPASKYKYPAHYLITEKIKDDTDIITFKNQKYNQDCVLISNNNKSLGGHTIAGIKCKGVKHVYNGWTRLTIDPALGKRIIEKEGKIEIPCEYMRFEWKTNEKNEFVINPITCELVNKSSKLPNIKKLVFSFNTFDRVMIYTKIITNSPPIVIPVQEVKPPVFIKISIPDALPDGTSIGASSIIKANIKRKLAPKFKDLSEASKILESNIKRNLTPNIKDLSKASSIIKANIKRKKEPNFKDLSEASKILQAIMRRKITPAVIKPTVTKPAVIKPPKTPKTPKIKICKEGSTLNTLSNRCNKNCTILQEKSPATGRCRKLCTNLQERNADTGRCKKIKVPKIYKI